MSISATKLRQNLYYILDKVIDTGIPVEIERKSYLLKIVPDNPKSKLEQLERHDCLNCKLEEIIEIDWYKEWKGYRGFAISYRVAPNEFWWPIFI